MAGGDEIEVAGIVLATERAEGTWRVLVFRGLAMASNPLDPRSGQPMPIQECFNECTDMEFFHGGCEFTTSGNERVRIVGQPFTAIRRLPQNGDGKDDH